MSVLARLLARDRALFLRIARGEDSGGVVNVFWKGLTHLGGATLTVLAAVVPLMAGGVLAGPARRALATLVLSHLVVQLVKRTVGRARPSRSIDCAALTEEPDRFSFPSGHAAAAMSIAVAYAAAFPTAATPLILSAALVGMSRVVLGVHYPGDVLIGELIAVLTAIPIVFR